MSMRRRCSSRRLTRSTRSSVPADDRADVPPNCTQTRDTNRGRTGRPCADAASRRALPARVWSRRRDSAVIVGSSNVRTRGSTVSGSSRCGMNVAQTPMRHFSRLDALSSAGSSSNQSFVRRSKALLALLRGEIQKGWEEPGDLLEDALLIKALCYRGAEPLSENLIGPLEATTL